MATRLVLAGVAAPGSWHQQVLKGVEKQRFGCWQGWPRWLCGNGMEKSLLSSLFHDELCRHEWLKHRGNVKLSKWQCLKLFDVSCGVAIWRSEFTSDFVSEILEECNEKQSCCFLPMKLFRNSPISEKLLSLNRYKLWKNVTVGHASIAENWTQPVKTKILWKALNKYSALQIVVETSLHDTGCSFAPSAHRYRKNRVSSRRNLWRPRRSSHCQQPESPRGNEPTVQGHVIKHIDDKWAPFYLSIITKSHMFF